MVSIYELCFKIVIFVAYDLEMLVAAEVKAIQVVESGHVQNQYFHVSETHLFLLAHRKKP